METRYLGRVSCLHCVPHQKCKLYLKGKNILFASTLSLLYTSRLVLRGLWESLKKSEKLLMANISYSHWFSGDMKPNLRSIILTLFCPEISLGSTSHTHTHTKRIWNQNVTKQIVKSIIVSFCMEICLPVCCK